MEMSGSGDQFGCRIILWARSTPGNNTNIWKSNTKGFVVGGGEIMCIVYPTVWDRQHWYHGRKINQAEKTRDRGINSEDEGQRLQRF